MLAPKDLSRICFGAKTGASTETNVKMTPRCELDQDGQWGLARRPYE